MKTYKGYTPTQIVREPNELGESIEEKIRRSTANKEPIEMTDNPIYTPRKDGVRPEFNIRTDRFDLALDAVDKFSKSVRSRAKDGAEDPFAKPAEDPTPKSE